MMKRSVKPTPYLLIKANTMSDDDLVNYAIIHITEAWLQLVHDHFSKVAELCLHSAFNCFSYWDAPLDYYYIPEQDIKERQLLKPFEDHAFIRIAAAELEMLRLAGNRLDGHQFLITIHGIAHFKAFAYGTGEKYWTQEFNLKRLLKELNSIFHKPLGIG